MKTCKRGHLWASEDKRCLECKRFTSNRWNSANKEYHRERVKKERKDNPGKYRAWDNARYKRDKDKRLTLSRNQKFKTYGITEETYQQKIIEQNGRCLICKQVKTLCVDHCHETGRIRGLLCRKCNLLLGCAEDRLDTLREAYNYLEKNQNNATI